MADAIPPKVSKIVDVLVSLGASVVLFGALQKLMHTSMADIMLQVGLYTESAIFLGYGILYLYYPAVDDRGIPVEGADRKEDIGNTALKSMEKMLEEADITPANLSKLSGSFQKLNTSVSQIGEIGDVLKSTNEFTIKTKEATHALGSVSGAVNQAVTSLSSLSALNSVSESTKQFHGQVQVLTKNLSSLNTVYELELQESNNQLKALNQFYGKLAQTSAAMNSSADDAIKAKEQITLLANNLGKLNQVYGSMLTAMQGR
jgi:gliding motility-associated protein GldL